MHRGIIVAHVSASDPVAGTFGGSGRRVIVDNEPCLQEVLGFACHIEEQQCCLKRRVDTQWGVIEDVEEAVLGHRQPDASGHRQELRQEHHPRGRAVARQLDDVPHQLCARLPPPSSLPSILCGSP